MKTAVIYSCHLDGRESEPDNDRQIMLCLEYAKQHSIEIVGIYIDCLATKRSPLCMRELLLKECQQKQWDMVLFSSVAILERNFDKKVKFLANLNKYVDYKFADGEYDYIFKMMQKLVH